MYRANVAYVHHRGFGDFAEAAGRSVLKILKQHDVTAGHVVDLGCGDGRWLRALTMAGYQATGIEQSAAFVGLARSQAPGALIRRASLHKVTLPACDAITAFGEVFNYLPQSGPAPGLIRTFARAHEALRPGGLLMFDMLVAGKPLMNYETWRTGSGWAVLARVSEDPHTRHLDREIVAFRSAGRLYTRQEEIHRLRVPTKMVVLADLRRSGFSVRASRGYGAFQVPARRVVFLAIKRR
jgi:SAM-dependent methyltransferase